MGSADEVETVARLVPGRRVARVEVAGHGSPVPLGVKFGTTSDEAVDLLERARKLGLRPAGVTTHTGS